MSQKKESKGRGPSSAMVRPPVAPPVETPAGEGQVWSFPSRVLCPSCGSINIDIYGTHGRTRYCKCLAAGCMRRFQVVGQAPRRP